MSRREVHIISYFSRETDLARAMRSWPEYVSGAGNEVTLRDGEALVSIRLVDGEEKYVSVVGSGNGLLFERALGAALYALARDSDHLMVNCVS